LREGSLWQAVAAARRTCPRPRRAAERSGGGCAAALPPGVPTLGPDVTRRRRRVCVAMPP